MALTKDQRDELPDSAFAVPETRDLPIHDERHVRMAWSQVDRTRGLSKEQRAHARTRIRTRAHELGIDTTDWDLRAVSFTLEAMSLALPEVEDHPNRMPFSGVLTRVDEPSDEPPGGADGKRVLIPKAVAEQALPTLLGMAIDYTDDFDGHNHRAKIGIITEATIEGNAIRIAGFLYASDFPEECARIQQEKTRLGFSYECKVAISDKGADPWVVSRIVFTGAALLYKDKAAYHSTSLAARSAAENEVMDPKDMKALTDSIAALGKSLGEVQKTVDANAKEVATLKAGKGSSLAGPIIDQVTPHVGALNAAADAMECAGIGSHPTLGHAAHVRRVAGHLLQAAVAGHLPQIYRDHNYLEAVGTDKGGANEAAVRAANEKAEKLEKELVAMRDTLNGLNTQISDLQATAKKQAEEPQRKTERSAQAVELLSKFDIKASEGETITAEAADKALEAAGVKGTAAIAAKLKLRSAGVLA